MPDFDAAAGQPARSPARVSRIRPGSCLSSVAAYFEVKSSTTLATCGDIVIVDVEGAPVHVVEIAIEEHLALAGVGEDQEFMAVLAADRSRLGAHRHGLQSHAREGAQIGDEHLVVGVLARLAA